MSLKLNQLKTKSLFKELDYLSSEIEWKEMYVYDMESEFLLKVKELLESDSELKKLYDERCPTPIEKPPLEHIIDEGEEEIIEGDIDFVSKDPKLKSLYREVVKLTHPDKTDDSDMNELYLKVTKMYEQDDMFGMYRICNELGIPYDVESSESEGLVESISKLKSRIKFLENSYTYTWANTEDEKVRDKLIYDFIKQQIS